MAAPDRPPLRDPWIALATGFGSGYLPKAPGTWGSALATLLAWPLLAIGGPVALLAAAALASLIGLKAAGVYAERSGRHDAGPVVIDEFAGQWLTLAFCPLDPVWFVAGFVCFRVFDILKPPPIGWIDRRLAGAGGVMLDDLVAGLYAGGVLVFAAWWLAASAG